MAETPAAAVPQRKMSKRASVMAPTDVAENVGGDGAAPGEEARAPAAALERRASRRKSTAKKDGEVAADQEQPKNDDSAPVADAEAPGDAAAAPAPVEGDASAAKAPEPKASRRKSSLKKGGRAGSVFKKGDDRLDEDDAEAEEVPKIIYPIDSKIQSVMRKAWTLFIKKGQKKKTEIAEQDIATVMRSIAINPTETQVKDVIAYTRSQDVSTTSKGFLTYECFEQRMAESFQLEPGKYIRNGRERVLAALQTISGGAKEMDAADLKKILMTKGDAMTEQEAALMVRNVGDRDTGKVYIEEYADILSQDGIPQPPPDPTVW